MNTAKRIEGPDKTTAMKLARYFWAAPCSATGLALASPALLFGASAKRIDGVLEISLAGWLRHAGLRPLPFRAITFGHVVIGMSRASLRRLRSHERVHVRQYETWGVLFFAAYPLSSLLQLLRGRNPYWHNWFEIQAHSTQEHAPQARISKHPGT